LTNPAIELDPAMELDPAIPTQYYPLIKRFDEETEDPMIYQNEKTGRRY